MIGKWKKDNDRLIGFDSNKPATIKVYQNEHILPNKKITQKGLMMPTTENVKGTSDFPTLNH